MQSEPEWVMEKRRSSVAVMAGPLGFCGRAFDLWYGPLRTSIEMAARDADYAADCIEQSPCGIQI